MSTGTVVPRAGYQWAWQLGFAVLVVAVAAGLLAGPYRFLFGNVAGSTAQPARPAPCLPGAPVAIMDSPHISQSQASDVAYNSQPPSSGPHFPFTIAAGVYQQPVPDGLTIHAMEHGHVIVHYAPDLPAGQVATLEQVARRYGADVVLTPNPALPRGVAVTAWGRIEHLDTADQPRISRFIEALRDRYNHGWTRDQDCPPG